MSSAYHFNMAPSLSALLGDPSVDHTGPPIPVEYSTLWSRDAMAKRVRERTLGQNEIDFIREQLTPAAVKWEWEQGNTYYHPQWPIHDGNAGLKGAKFVPIRLNRAEGKTIDSLACQRALIRNDFASKRRNPLPVYLIPNDLVRWRLCGDSEFCKNKGPARYLVWQSEREARFGPCEGLYARIPKPMEGLSRAASCDHCRIHDRELVRETVDYFDDRPGVDTLCEKRAVDSAVTPFSLCRFHWWYVQSGQLLGRGHVHALEMLLSENLLERWGFYHMKEFLYSVDEQSSKLYERERLDFDRACSLIPKGLLDDLGIRNSSPPRTGAEATDPQDAGGPSTPVVPQETVASTDEQPLVLGGQAAVTTTADTDQQSDHAPASHATGLDAPTSPLPVAQPQTNGTSARRPDGLLYEPPRMPCAMRARRGRNRKGK